MWVNPIYHFEKKRQKCNGKSISEIITIDVTGSAPTMSDPGQYLKDFFKVACKGKDPKKILVLDFGAAKLRNTLYLLEEGYQVRAVEFEELSNRMPQARTNWENAENNYSNFKKLIFPRDFYALSDKIDIALFINVMNVMPLPLERIAALMLCRKKMKEDGLLLWVNWRPASSAPKKYSEKNQLNDGWFMGGGKKKKTFHVEWNKEETFDMLAAAGFSQVDSFDIETLPGNSHFYIFKADKPILLEKTIQLKEIEDGGLKRNHDDVLPEVFRPSMLNLYLEELKSLPSGPENATKYRHIATRLIAGIFNTQLKNPEMEVPISEGLGKIDAKFKNRNEKGFFKNAKEMHDIKCPSIFMECKNCSVDIGNPAFDQLSGRLDKPDRGQLGILACREIKDKPKVLKHCKEKMNSKKCLIVLSDKDFEELVKLKLGNKDKTIDDYMEKKLDEIID